MIVWAAMIPMFVLLTIRNLIHGILPAPSRLVRFAATWAGTLVAITYVAVAASVVVVFFPVLTSS
jgi:low affinity Fe/Cu permease